MVIGRTRNLGKYCFEFTNFYTRQWCFEIALELKECEFFLILFSILFFHFNLLYIIFLT